MRVRPTAEMSEAEFSQHINFRHLEQGEFADLGEVEERSVRPPKDRAVFEAYHRRLHSTREYQHEHRDL